MNKIGIIFAMDEELESLKKYLILEKESNIFGLKFYEGTISSKQCVLVKSGIGKVNAARSTQILIDNYNIEYIFNIGVAGGIDETLKVGDIVISSRLVQHDFDLTAFNYNKGFIPEVNDVYIYASRNLLELAERVIKKAKVGIIASGDIFCTETWMSQKINTKFSALCVEMEGSAIAQVCHLCKKKFLVIRSISDVPNNDNVVTYEEFLEKASCKVADAMKKIIEKL